MKSHDWDIRNEDIDLRMTNNVMPTQALFYEFGNKEALYTLKSRDVEKDGKVYLSLYQIYMSSTDEYEAALRFVGDMGHWRKLCKLKWFTEGADQFSYEGVIQMRQDMAARDSCSAKKKLVELCNEGNVTAARALYGEKQTKPVGRTARKTLRDTDQVADSIVADIARIRGVQNG